jgi:hypothetical protein
MSSLYTYRTSSMAKSKVSLKHSPKNIATKRFHFAKCICFRKRDRHHQGEFFYYSIEGYTRRRGRCVSFSNWSGASVSARWICFFAKEQRLLRGTLGDGGLACKSDERCYSYSESRPLRSRLIKKLRLHILFLLSKEAKKLRRSQAQAKKIVKKLRLGLLPYDSSF